MKIQIKNKGKGKAELYLYEAIGSGWMGGISAKDVADALKSMGSLTEIKVRINSPGGDVFDGVAIYNQLVKNSAKIVVEIDGLAASIASIIAMAGDEINMPSNAMIMIHDPWMIAAGTAEELRDQAELLDKIRGQLLSTYQTRTGGDLKEISDMMAAETWMTADEALEHGFIDNITDEVQAAASFDLSKFKHAPKSLQNQTSEPTLQPTSTRTEIDSRLKLLGARLTRAGIK